MKTSVGWIGLGSMGAAMAARVARAGFPLTAWNRTASRAQPVEGLGARIAATPREAAAAAEILVVMVATPQAFAEVAGGAEGFIAGLRDGALLVDMGTNGRETATRAEALARARGASFIDAPVLGSVKPAEEGKLVVLAGGSDGDLARARPLFEVLARAIHHVGPVGSGQAMKLAANFMLVHMLAGLAGSLSLARASGVSPSALVEILEAGLGSPYFRGKGTLMIEGRFEPQFALDLVRKDLGLIRRALEASGLDVPTIGPLLEMFDEASRRGWGTEDGAAVSRLWWPRS
jgi:3-hydroxyisobutyrate dehydrogenase-like beta-hydroxyacid dehydrogenase